jgi:hypothetical protein
MPEDLPDLQHTVGPSDYQHDEKERYNRNNHTQTTPNTGWHQTTKRNTYNGVAIVAEPLPIPLHMQQQSTNSTYTLKRVKGRTGEGQITMIWPKGPEW